MRRCIHKVRCPDASGNRYEFWKHGVLKSNPAPPNGLLPLAGPCATHPFTARSPPIPRRRIPFPARSPPIPPTPRRIPFLAHFPPQGSIPRLFVPDSSPSPLCTAKRPPRLQCKFSAARGVCIKEVSKSAPRFREGVARAHQHRPPKKKNL